MHIDYRAVDEPLTFWSQSTYYSLVNCRRIYMIWGLSMPLMIKLNRNIMKVYLCLDNGHFITVGYYIVKDCFLKKKVLWFMEVLRLNMFNIIIVLLVVLIDFFLQNKIDEKRYVFLYINKSRLRYLILVLFLAFFLYFLLNKKYLLILCLLGFLRIIDKFIYIYKNNL